MESMIQVQDKLVATVKKCCEVIPSHEGLCIKHRKGGAFKAAMNKARRAIEAMGFNHTQASQAVRDACDMANLELRCEA